MRANLIRNHELVQAVLEEVFDSVKEDNSPHPSTVNVAGIPVVAMSTEEGVHGIIAIQPFGLNASHLSLAIRPNFYGHKDNLELARMGVQQCSNLTGHSKHVMMIPTEDKDKLRFAQRVGFKREGVIRNSFLRNNQLIDQYIVGVNI